MTTIVPATAAVQPSTPTATEDPIASTVTTVHAPAFQAQRLQVPATHTAVTMVVTLAATGLTVSVQVISKVERTIALEPTVNNVWQVATAEDAPSQHPVLPDISARTTLVLLHNVPTRVRSTTTTKNGAMEPAATFVVWAESPD